MSKERGKRVASWVSREEATPGVAAVVGAGAAFIERVSDLGVEEGRGQGARLAIGLVCWCAILVGLRDAYRVARRFSRTRGLVRATVQAADSDMFCGGICTVHRDTTCTVG